ncbi:Mediator of RNA polymerase II transcription subunit 16 [Spathaspora sp. JA1]|nr:Mediator of RNA polymerase II transcription subunit 16 [Spathaspora sp. JA1]
MDKQSLTNKHLASLTNTSKLISWSKNGFIAYSSPGGGNGGSTSDNLFLTYLENINGQTWQLATPQPINIKLENNFLPEISLVSWSSLSTDLAIADVYGNFYILLAGVGLLDNSTIDNGAAGTTTNGRHSPSTISPSYELTSYNHMEMIYRDIINQDSKSSVNPGASIVAFKWLNIEKPQLINKPAVLATTETNSTPSLNSSSNGSFAYTYGVSSFQSHGVTHPISTKQACVALRQNGQFMVYFQGEHKVEYHKLCVSLSEGISIITMASIGFTNDKQIIITCYDSITDTISTYSVTIDWGFLNESAKRQKVDPHYHTPKEEQKLPKLILNKIHDMKPMSKYIDTEEEEVKQDEDRMDIDNDNVKYSIGELSSIDVISANAEKESKLSVLLSYSYTDHANQVTSSIYRYNLTDKLDLVTDAFIDLGIRKGISPSQATKKSTTTLGLMDKITRSGKIRNITTTLADFYMLIMYMDGRIDVIDLTTWKLVTHSTDQFPPSTISTIFDVGFSFPKLPANNPLILAVSPNMTSIVYTPIYSETCPNLNLVTVEKTRHTGYSSRDLFTTSVGFAFRHAYACYTNTCSDDLLILVQFEIVRLRNKLLETKKVNSNVEVILDKFIESIITESHKAINFQLDGFSKETVDKLLSNPPLQKLLSLQLVLGEFVNKKCISSDIAWIILNLRSTSFGIMFTISSIYRQISKKKPSEDTLQDSIARAECIVSLIGNVKWLIDLIVYLNQELIQLSLAKRHDEKDPISRLTIDNSIVLSVILGKVPRLFLMYAISAIGKTHEVLKKVHKDLNEANKLFTPMKECLNRFFTICDHAPITMTIFENFLRECDALITKELSTNVTSPGVGLRLEQKLVCRGEITGEMVQIAPYIIERYTGNINRELRALDIYFFNVDWLKIGIVHNSLSKSDVLSPVLVNNDGSSNKTIPRLEMNDGIIIDALRKINISPGSKVRKCSRCRAISLVSDPLVFEISTTPGLWTMVFQRTCLCGSVWINCDV